MYVFLKTIFSLLLYINLLKLSTFGHKWKTLPDKFFSHYSFIETIRVGDPFTLMLIFL